MKTTVKMAMAFLAIAATAGTAAVANDRHGGRDRRDGGMRFDRADADSSGDVTFEEFAAAINGRIGNADADKDGKITLAEIASEVERMRAERIAKRLMERFDTNGDGVLTTAEVEARQKKIFAFMDKNDDGKIAKEEMRQGRGWRRNN